MITFKVLFTTKNCTSVRIIEAKSPKEAYDRAMFEPICDAKICIEPIFVKHEVFQLDR